MPDEEKTEAEHFVPRLPPTSTIYNLRELIQRCFDEGKKAGFLLEYNAADGPRVILQDEFKLTQHIALTIVGEMKELEIVRKVGPMFRMFRELEGNFKELDDAATADFKLRNMRVAP